MKNMKKIALLTLIATLVIVGCDKKEDKESNKDTTTQTTAQDNATVDLSAETSEYKKFVEEQIGMLLKDTENFAQLLKDGKLEEAKKVYPLIRMAYERSEPIAESF